ncbi:MAG: LLM class flavin-dependent oxidoreductase [Steroidobacter sp.]
MAQKQLKLGAFLIGSGHHVAAWRHPDAQPQGNLFENYRRAAQTAERALFDAIFFADSLAVDEGHYASGLSRIDGLEPLTLLGALAASTQHIGLIATATATYNEPFHVARKFASLDRISNGRAGWNLVTSDNAAEAGNFHREEHVAHADRYARAREFYQVVTGLWDTWDEGAVLADKASGQYFDTSAVHRLNHKGEHFSVKGPLNVARSPQGWPVVVQAGSSEAGKQLAAQTADVVFTAQASLANAQKFYRDLKDRLPAFGRHADDLKIMPGVLPIVGRTREEAQAKFQQLQDLVDPRAGVALLGRMIGNFDLSKYPIDGPLPELPETQSGQRSRQQLFTELARGENLTIRELYLRIAGGRGHLTVIGTAETVADELQRWLEEGGADGFNVMPALLPNSLEDFATYVVPELQRRGIFRTRYEGSTLRDRLGLPHRRSQLSTEYVARTGAA